MSLRYNLIQNGAVKQFADGREVCLVEKPKGREEYRRRVAQMILRQHGRCRICLRALSLQEATFDHENGKGMGGARSDDRLADNYGNEINAAVHLHCNLEKGSRRGYEIYDHR